MGTGIPTWLLFVPITDPEAWGAGLSGSPGYRAFKDPLNRFTVVYDSGWEVVGWDGCVGG